jgi:hypothetical protein
MTFKPFKYLIWASVLSFQETYYTNIWNYGTAVVAAGGAVGG